MDFATQHGGPPLGDLRRRRRVLIVDDDRDLVQTLMMALKDEGYEPHGVYASRYVVESVTDIEPDVVVLNTNMPDMTASSVVRAIRTQRGSASPAFIGLIDSGRRYRSLAEKILARPVGFKFYLEKPFASEELLALLADIR